MPRMRLPWSPAPETAPETGEVRLAAAEDPLTEPMAIAAPIARINDQMTLTREVQRVTLVAANRIPAVRRALGVIAGTISTWPLVLYANGRPVDPGRLRSFLEQPAPASTRSALIRQTVTDVIWWDRAVWRILDRTVLGHPTAVERLDPQRVAPDPARPGRWLVDGRPERPLALVVFDGGGLGGLAAHGWDVLTIYSDLQAAAGRYARAPHPHAVLRNLGADISREDAEALLNEWEAARGRRSVAYLNRVTEYQAVGWSASEVQLTEGRELAALEVARLFGLPSVALDARSGDSMTYANVADRRRDVYESLRPWQDMLEQSMSAVDRTAGGQPAGVLVPARYSIRLDPADYLRDAPADRATTWATLIAAGVITPEQAAQLDPTTRGLHR